MAERFAVESALPAAARLRAPALLVAASPAGRTGAEPIRGAGSTFAFTAPEASRAQGPAAAP